MSDDLVGFHFQPEERTTLINYHNALADAFHEQLRLACDAMAEVSGNMLPLIAFWEDRQRTADAHAAMAQHVARAVQQWCGGRHREAFLELEWALEKGEAVEHPGHRV
jgi:hypothetical protein